MHEHIEDARPIRRRIDPQRSVKHKRHDDRDLPVVAARCNGNWHADRIFALVCGVALMYHLNMMDAQIIAQNLINGADSFR
jgi:hypothetical protein